MEPDVMRAMAKWPRVPAVYGWLQLDRNGRWLLRGQPVTHVRQAEFINRNYAVDENGNWFFQNGPQRVFVALAYTPWIYQFGPGALKTHTGLEVHKLSSAFCDERGDAVLLTEHGPGLVHHQDLAVLYNHIQGIEGPLAAGEIEARLLQVMAGRCADLVLKLASSTVPLQPLNSAGAPMRFGYCQNPGPTAAEGE